jgi:hypothetical protein
LQVRLVAGEIAALVAAIRRDGGPELQALLEPDGAAPSPRDRQVSAA